MSWMIILSSCLIWQIISSILPPNGYGCVNAWTTLGSGHAKKIIFSDEAHFDLGGYVNKQNARIWGTENPHRFWYIIGIHKMNRERPLQSMAIVIGPRWTNFYSQKLKRRILARFGFNRTALRATQPKLHSMFCALLLKIALSAAELMSFGHLGAAIWHRWTIICGVPSKISVTPTSQRQLTL